MKKEPIICFGQQPCGFFPKRYLIAKINTARKLQEEIGGRIVFFYHDSDADYRETITILEDLKTKEEVRLNFTQENKIQKKFSPLYSKRIPTNWRDEIVRKLPRFVNQKIIEMFKIIKGDTVADFCLEMYIKTGLLEGIEIVRSSDKDFRIKASQLETFYADIPYEGEVVRALMYQDNLRLHTGGGEYLQIQAPASIDKWQKNAGRDYRFGWMQSVVNCTHYILGAGENAYLKKEDFPDVNFVPREFIEKQDLAYIPDLL